MSVLSPPQEVVVRKKRKRRSLADRLDMRIEQVELQMAATREDMREQFVIIREEIRDLRQESRDLRQDMREQFARVDVKFERVDTKIDKARGDMISLMMWQTGLIGVMLVILGLVVSWVRH